MNKADAAALSDAETAVMADIVLLSAERPLTLALLDLTPIGTDQWRKASGDLDKVSRCIAAWRLALRKLSGDEPEACHAELQSARRE